MQDVPTVLNPFSISNSAATHCVYTDMSIQTDAHHHLPSAGDEYHGFSTVESHLQIWCKCNWLCDAQHLLIPTLSKACV